MSAETASPGSFAKDVRQCSLYSTILLKILSSPDCDGRADVIIAIDVSGSIRRERFATIQEFVAGIVEQFEVSQRKTRVGVASWSDEATVDFNLNEFELKQDVLTVKQVYPSKCRNG